MPTGTEKLVPPYIPWATLVNFFAHLKSTAVPGRIDKTVFPNSFTPPLKGQIQSALRFLRLIDGAGMPDERLRNLIAAYDTEQWGEAVKLHILPVYADITGNLALEDASPSQLHDRFKSFGLDGQMLLKSIRFYMAMLKDTGLKFSPHLENKRTPGRRRSPKTFSRSKAPASLNGDHAEATTDRREQANPKGTRRFPLFFKGKPEGSLVVPEDLNEADYKVIEAQVKVLQVLIGT